MKKEGEGRKEREHLRTKKDERTILGRRRKKKKDEERRERIG